MNEPSIPLDASFSWIVPISLAALGFVAGVLIQDPRGRELLSRLPRLVDPHLVG